MKTRHIVMMVLVAMALTGCEDNPDSKPRSAKIEGEKAFIEAESRAIITKPVDRRNLRITMDETLALAKWGGSGMYEWVIEPDYGYVLPNESMDGEFTFHPIHPGECKIILEDKLAQTNEYDSITLYISN